MPQGFFTQSTLLQSKAPISRIPRCGACGLYKKCQSPKMPVSGKGLRKILLVGEAPGRDEDRIGRAFVGVTGQLLEKTLRKFGIDMRRDCWITNSLICRPKDNATPTSSQIEFCRPNLINTIEHLKPEIIVPLGAAAVQSLIGAFWKGDVGPIGRWVGWHIPHQKLNAWICPTWHPSFIARTDYGTKKKNEVAELIWKLHLEKISELNSRPWEVVPDYRKQIRRVFDPSEAAKIIRENLSKCQIAAFDYETNMLKPDWPDKRIISCAISFDGKITIAYPWYGEAVSATKEFLTSPIRKIASNLKFEDRWSGARTVKNWWWDTMLGAHVHDNRRRITGLKFQAFVWLGVDSYDDHIKQFLRTKGSDRVNRAIKEIELDKLLLYNGLDAVLEYHVALKQRKSLGYDTN